MSALGGGVAARATAAVHAGQFLAVHTLMEPGCHIVAATRLYGGSLNQIGHSFRKMDWHASFVDTDDPANVAAAITDKTRCIFVESIANPGGVVSELAGLDRKSVVKGKSGSVRVDLGGRRIIKKKNTRHSLTINYKGPK